MAAETGPIVNHLSGRMSNQANTDLQRCQSEIEALRLAHNQLYADFERLKERTPASGTENPSSTQDESDTRIGPIIGTFSFTEIRPPNQPPPPKGGKSVRFSSPYSAPPDLPVGLRRIDLMNSKGICVNSAARNVKNDCFEIYVEALNNTMLHDVVCTWLELSTSTSDSDFQFGIFDTRHVHSRAQQQQLTAHRITFQRPYSTPPQIVVWLCSFSMGDTNGWRVRTYATDVTKTGFIIHIDTWGDSVLSSGAATWIAYPANKPKVCSGSFGTWELHRRTAPQHHNSGYAKFGDGIFTTPPRVALAINSFNIDNKRNARLELDPSNIGTEGMTWTLASWDDTILHSAGGSFIALG